MSKDYVNKIEARSVRKILFDLSMYVKNALEDADFARPDISILIGGQTLRGLFYKTDNDNNDEWLLLKLLDNKFDAIGTFPVSGIQALIINNPEPIAHIISGGKISRPLKEAEVGDLELKRVIEEVSTAIKISIKLSDNIPKSPVINANILDIVKMLKIVLGEIGEENVKSITEILIDNAAVNEVAIAKEGSVILVHANLKAYFGAGLKNKIANGLDWVL